MSSFIDSIIPLPSQEERKASSQKQELIAELLGAARAPQKQNTTQLTPSMSPQQVQDTYNRQTRERKLGQVMALTGDPVASQLGMSMAKLNPDKWLQDQNRMDENRQYRQGHLQNGRGNRLNSLTDALRAMNDSESGGAGRMYKMPKSHVEDINTNVGSIRSLNTARGTFRPEFAQNISKHIGTAGYTGFLDGFSRWFVQNSPKITDPDMREAAQWWADLDANIIQPWRHGEFGATLTPNEQRAMDEMALLKPGMDPQDILDRLDNLLVSRKNKGRDLVVDTLGAYGPGYKPMLLQHYGDILDETGKKTYDHRGESSQPKEEESGEKEEFSIEWKSTPSGLRYRRHASD